MWLPAARHSAAEGEALVLSCQEAPAALHLLPGLHWVPGFCGNSWAAEGGHLESAIGQMEGYSCPPACTLFCFFPCSLSRKVRGSRHQGYSSRLQAVIPDYGPNCPFISALSCELQIHCKATIKSSAPGCLNLHVKVGEVAL